MKGIPGSSHEDINCYVHILLTTYHSGQKRFWSLLSSTSLLLFSFLNPNITNLSGKEITGAEGSKVRPMELSSALQLDPLCSCYMHSMRIETFWLSDCGQYNTY